MTTKQIQSREFLKKIGYEVNDILKTKDFDFLIMKQLGLDLPIYCTVKGDGSIHLGNLIEKVTSFKHCYC